MRNFSYIFFTLSVVFLLSTQNLQAQKYKSNKGIAKYKGGSIGRLNKAQKYHVFGININAMNYFGDLSPLNRVASTDVSFTRPGLGISYGYHFNPFLTIRAAFNYGRIMGDDFNSADPLDYSSLTRYARNLHFRNDIKELSLGFEIDLVPNYKGPYSRANLTPFLYAGLAIFHHDPMAIAPERAPNGNTLPEAGQWIRLKPLGTEGQFSTQVDVEPYSNFAFAIPLGVGLKLKLPGDFNAVIELGYRYLFTDYLDDVSGSFVDLGILDSDLAKAMSDRSRETTAVRAEAPRQLNLISEANIGSPTTYVSPTDGQTYTVIPGYGNTGQIRGNPANDIYFITQIKINYLLSSGRRGYRSR